MLKNTKYRINLLLKSFKKDEFSLEESTEYLIEIYRDSKMFNGFNMLLGFVLGAITTLIIFQILL